MSDYLNLTDVSTAMEIFMHLLEHKYLTEEDNRELFDEYSK